MTLTIPAIPIIGLPLAITTLLTKNFLEYQEEKKKLISYQLPNEIIEYFQEKIKEHEESIKNKKNVVEQITKEIEKEEKELDEIKKLIKIEI